MKIIAYRTEDEKQNIIDNQKTQGFDIVGISNITEGNFLGFMDAAPTMFEVDTAPAQLTEIQNTLDILLLKQEGII